MSGSQAGGVTTLEFFRLLDTGDTAGDRVIGEVRIYTKINAPTHVMQLQHYVLLCDSTKSLWTTPFYHIICLFACNTASVQYMHV